MYHNMNTRLKKVNTFKLIKQLKCRKQNLEVKL